MLDKNIPVIISVVPLDWDYLNDNTEEEINYTGNVKFLARREDNGDIVYDDRYSIKLSRKATKEEYLKKIKDLHDFLSNSLESLQNLYHSSYKINDSSDLELDSSGKIIAFEEKVSVDLIEEVNQHVYSRWPSLFATKYNDEFTGSVSLFIWENSNIDLYEGKKEKARIKFFEKDFDNFNEFSKKMNTMCYRWNTRKISEENKKEVFLNMTSTLETL